MTPTIHTQTTEEAQTATQPPSAMQFLLQQELLLNTLTAVMKSVGTTRFGPPILQHIQIQADSDHVAISASNLATGICLSIPAEVEGLGTWTIPAKAFSDSIKTFSKGQTLTVQVSEDRLLVKGGKRTFSLKSGTNGHDFPILPQALSDMPYTLESNALREAIRAVEFAASGDPMEPLETAICLHAQEEQAHLVAVSGPQMAWHTLTLSTRADGSSAQVLLPAVSMRLLAGLLSPDVKVSITWSEKQAVFQAGNLRFVTWLVEGTYYKYWTALPKNHTTTFTLERQALLRILAAFKSITRDSSDILRVSYTSGQVLFHAESDDLGEVNDVLETEVLGKEGTTLFNAQMLEAMLKAVPEDALTFSLLGIVQPCLICPVGRDDYRYVQTPMSPK